MFVKTSENALTTSHFSLAPSVLAALVCYSKPFSQARHKYMRKAAFRQSSGPKYLQNDGENIHSCGRCVRGVCS